MADNPVERGRDRPGLGNEAQTPGEEALVKLLALLSPLGPTCGHLALGWTPRCSRNGQLPRGCSGLLSGSTEPGTDRSTFQMHSKYLFATKPALLLYLRFWGGAGYSMKTKTLICEELARSVCFQLLTSGPHLGVFTVGSAE